MHEFWNKEKQFIHMGYPGVMWNIQEETQTHVKLSSHQSNFTLEVPKTIRHMFMYVDFHKELK